MISTKLKTISLKLQQKICVKQNRRLITLWCSSSAFTLSMSPCTNVVSASTGSIFVSHSSMECNASFNCPFNNSASSNFRCLKWNIPESKFRQLQSRPITQSCNQTIQSWLRNLFSSALKLGIKSQNQSINQRAPNIMHCHRDSPDNQAINRTVNQRNYKPTKIS